MTSSSPKRRQLWSWAWCTDLTDADGRNNAKTMDYYPGDDYCRLDRLRRLQLGQYNGGKWVSFEECSPTSIPLLAEKGNPSSSAKWPLQEPAAKSPMDRRHRPRLRSQIPA